MLLEGVTDWVTCKTYVMPRVKSYIFCFSCLHSFNCVFFYALPKIINKQSSHLRIFIINNYIQNETIPTKKKKEKVRGCLVAENSFFVSENKKTVKTSFVLFFFYFTTNQFVIM